MRGRATGVAALAFLCAGAAAVPSGATDPPRRTIKVADNFYSPKQLAVPRNTVIVWKWARLNGETHDVYSARKPKGVKRIWSAPAATDYTFKRKLSKAGKYFFICTFHENMTMRVTVKR
jgi:plastocyanin